MNGNIAISYDARFKENSVVINSLEGGKPGDAVFANLPFKKRQEFELYMCFDYKETKVGRNGLLRLLYVQ